MPVSLEDIRDLHDQTSSKDLINSLKEGCLQHCGHAGDMFLATLAREREELTEQLCLNVKAISKRLTEPYPKCSGQVHRVAARFALSEAAGKLAVEWGILPHSSADIEASVNACFLKWIEHRETTEDDEVRVAVSRITGFIHQFHSRFEDEEGSSKPILNRAGYKLGLDESERYSVYGILRNVFHGEILGRDANKTPNRGLLRQLYENGLLIREKQRSRDRFVLDITTPDGTKAQVYKIRMPREEVPSPITDDADDSLAYLDHEDSSIEVDL